MSRERYLLALLFAAAAPVVRAGAGFGHASQIRSATSNSHPSTVNCSWKFITQVSGRRIWSLQRASYLHNAYSPAQGASPACMSIAMMVHDIKQTVDNATSTSHPLSPPRSLSIILEVRGGKYGRNVTVSTMPTGRRRPTLGLKPLLAAAALRQWPQFSSTPAMSPRLYVGRSNSPLATDNLLENTDGVLRPLPRGGVGWRGGSEHPTSVLSGRQPAASIDADGRSLSLSPDRCRNPTSTTPG